jgi:hypothetical protein
VRRECLDQLLIVGGQQLAGVMRRYVEHCSQRRPHRSVAQATPVPSDRVEARSAPSVGRRRRHEVVGGLIHEDESAAGQANFRHPARFRCVLPAGSRCRCLAE